MADSGHSSQSEIVKVQTSLVVTFTTLVDLRFEHGVMKTSSNLKLVEVAILDWLAVNCTQGK